MASNRNDDMERNRNTPQGGTPHDNRGQTGRDPVNRDRQMNRDTEVGQRGSGSGQGGRDSFGSDRDRSDTSRDTGRGGSNIEE
jgi:hypothetical protein